MRRRAAQSNTLTTDQATAVYIAHKTVTRISSQMQNHSTECRQFCKERRPSRWHEQNGWDYAGTSDCKRYHRTLYPQQHCDDLPHFRTFVSTLPRQVIGDDSSAVQHLCLRRSHNPRPGRVLVGDRLWPLCDPGTLLPCSLSKSPRSRSAISSVPSPLP